MNIIPKSIKRPYPGCLQAEWDDGFSSIIKLENFRKECPCADCREKKESNIGINKFIMPTIKPEQYDLKKLTPVGNYAINALWGDGHDSGIYPWEYFRELFEKFKLKEEEIKKIEEKSKSINENNIRNN